MVTEDLDLDAEDMDAECLRIVGEVLDRPGHSHGPGAAIVLARKLLFVRTRVGRVEPLRANAVQGAFEAQRGARNIVLKARQVGLTTWAAARFFLKTITHPGTLTLQVAHTQESAEDIFRIVHRFVDYLPKGLRTGCLRTSRANVRQIVFPELDSQYRVVSAGERNAGRGLTVQNLHCSELARWPGDPAETLAGLRAALAPDGEEILESTPYGIGGCFYQEWQSALETGAVRHFFPWWMERHYRTRAVEESSLTEEERMLLERHHLTLEQIGYRRKVKANFRGLARQEYAEDPESCFRASGDSVFELGPIEARLATAPAPIELRRNGEFEIWLPPLPGKQYLVSVDPAGGGSDGDYSAIEVIELASSLQCAEFAGHIGGLELAQLATEIAREYNHAWLAVERNNHGHGVLALMETVCHYPRLYRQGDTPGLLVTLGNKPALIGLLNAEIIEQPDHFMSRRLLAECRSFVRHPDGSMGARAGTHDDLVMATSIGLWTRGEILTGSGSRR
jgi:hypothetical protein